VNACRFCGEEDRSHRPDCSIYTKLFRSPPGSVCRDCGEPTGDFLFLAEGPGDAWVRGTQVVCGGDPISCADPMCLGCRAHAELVLGVPRRRARKATGRARQTKLSERAPLDIPGPRAFILLDCPGTVIREGLIH
jgi:hypothetical protein